MDIYILHWDREPRVYLFACFISFDTLNIDFNSSPPGQNGHYFADDIFSCIFVNG